MDVPWENLGRHFMESANFIKNAIKDGGTVFVHCWAGISRSTSCIIAYLMLHYGMNYAKALGVVRQGRHFVNPNPGFRKQLLEFEQKLALMRKEGRLPAPADFKEENKNHGMDSQSMLIQGFGQGNMQKAERVYRQRDGTY